jgi:hypothetical protein
MLRFYSDAMILNMSRDGRIIRDTMYRAEVKPMSKDPDLIPRMGLFKVVIYEGERFVRTDKENMVISVAEKLAEELNYQFGHKKVRGASKG